MSVFPGMAPDYLPRVSSQNCHYPFTFLGGLYHGCVENMENATATCERWGCMQINYIAAVCAADVGTLTAYSQPLRETRVIRSPASETLAEKSISPRPSGPPTETSV